MSALNFSLQDLMAPIIFGHIAIGPCKKAKPLKEKKIDQYNNNIYT
jgi:hypothetical protein